ncbi:hypothetical protein BO78DRAFT_71327 [Aspergillus sclerotiicarbonarius CBS 121057]|uniref:Uncharacterized protein n=1 Tax=Aspergillus sclerotiicarbonarius (strain CBS 121057 / IBT 28362) TaxID=1448318 RepID=A0A319EPE7_ASPSB|nr:hypothetical protein BO78DRAFT_71327 [Aspergillus sclerotiicarbonarius CBS 121057]
MVMTYVLLTCLLCSPNLGFWIWRIRRSDVFVILRSMSFVHWSYCLVDNLIPLPPPSRYFTYLPLPDLR